MHCIACINCLLVVIKLTPSGTVTKTIFFFLSLFLLWSLYPALVECHLPCLKITHSVSQGSQTPQLHSWVLWRSRNLRDSGVLVGLVWFFIGFVGFGLLVFWGFFVVVGFCLFFCLGFFFLFCGVLFVWWLVFFLLCFGLLS